jgi:hypothetical protein
MATRFISLLPCLALAVLFEATNTFDKVGRMSTLVNNSPTGDSVGSHASPSPATAMGPATAVT